MDHSGTPEAPCFSQNKASENYLRLCQLLNGICSHILRDILSHHIKPEDLRFQLNKNKTLLEYYMDDKQKELIYPASGGKSLTAKDLDISALYIILRNICNIPKYNWKSWKNPAACDKSIAACIERIKSRRNSVSHSAGGRVEEKEFKDHWVVLQDAIVVIEKRLTGGNLYKRGVDHLLSCDLTVQVKTYRHDDKSAQDVLQNEISVSDTAVDSSEIFYNNGEAGVQFSDLFEELSENVPERKLDQLKDIIESSCNMKYMASIYKAVSVRECFRILRRSQLFTPSDVIFVQYLLRKIGCKEQESKCLEFAEKQSALCFYEKPPTENGLTNVLFHVRGNLSEYSLERIEKIKETVAAILGCSPKEIQVNGFSPSTSFLLVLCIKNIYLMKLFDMDQRDKDKLIELNIDYLIIDLNIVYLERSEEIKWNLCYDPTLPDVNIILNGEQTTIPKHAVEDSQSSRMKYLGSGMTTNDTEFDTAPVDSKIDAIRLDEQMFINKIGHGEPYKGTYLYPRKVDEERFQQGEPLRKDEDNSFPYIEEQLLIKEEHSKRIGCIKVTLGKEIHGTGFRVGSKYFMTAFHVMMDVLIMFWKKVHRRLTEEERMQMEWTEDKIPVDGAWQLSKILPFVDPSKRNELLELGKQSITNCVQIKFGLVRDNINSFLAHCSYDVAFASPSHDVIILELIEDTNLPNPFHLKTINAEATKLHLIGHPAGKKLEHYSACKIIKDQKELEILIEKFFTTQGYGKDQVKEGYKPCVLSSDPDHLFFHCSKSITHGASGSPLIVIINEEMAQVTGMLLREHPEFNYKYDKDNWDRPDPLLASGISMGKVLSLLICHSLHELAVNLFPEQF